MITFQRIVLINLKYSFFIIKSLAIIIFSLQMDYEDIIKLEEESPVYSTGNNSQALRNYMTPFYENESQLFRREPQERNQTYPQISIEQAIDQIQLYIDIIDSPLEDVLYCFERMHQGMNIDKNILSKRILKRKNFLKRLRAKNRQPKLLYPYQQFHEMTIPTIMETEAQIKKKRNRVSAQISRDRKKLYFKELQIKNQKLQQEIIRARLENQKLKKQIQAAELPQKIKSNCDTFNNKLTKLLIFLGIICLIAMLKESFASTSSTFSKFKTSAKSHQMQQFAPIYESKLNEQGERKVAQFLQESQLQQVLFDCEGSKTPIFCESIQHQRNGKKLQFFQNLIDKLTDMKTGIEKNFD